MRIDFPHRQSAHCESGTAANLLHYHGVDVSEALAFGIGAGLFFGYLPFIRLNHLPLTTFRSATGGILKRVNKRLGIEVASRTFRDQRQGMEVLDQTLAEGIPVGLQTGAYWLPYFPPAYRFHFNMHNLVVIGKEGDDYLISDPIFPEVVRCPGRNLQLARFAKGTLAPKGKMYYLTRVPGQIDFQGPVSQGILEVCRAMLKTPLPFIGVRGIRLLAGRLQRWPVKLGADRAILHLGQLIRMQEEIGTGGAGFRFIYAAFLQEAADILGKEELREMAATMTGIGDRWRESAVRAARNCKGRASEEDSFAAMADILRDCAAREEILYRDLRDLVGGKQTSGFQG